VGGLYDFGPTGCAVKANLLKLWRKHFVLKEKMLEVSCTALTPDAVLRTSGHVEKFTDFMCKDTKTGDCHRADKILEDKIDDMVEKGEFATEKDKADGLAARSSADAFSRDELEVVLKKYSVVSPTTGNELGPPFPFNLMFVTSIGPTGKSVGYLRPETAQGIFVNFRRLLEYNGGRMPFAAAQVGLAFRNEISPRSGLLRVREFPLAEIEHFVHPEDKGHPRFKEVANLKLLLLAKADQTGEDISRLITVGEAVANGTINNETLGYFMARTHLFLVKAGIIPEKLRFRQHKDTEMAHYAKDCWDAEILMSYGWIECVGHADRAAYDLEVHSAKSKVDLVAQKHYDKPKLVEVAAMKLNQGAIGKAFRQNAKPVVAYLNALPKQEALDLGEQLKQGPVKITVNSIEVELQPNMLSVSLKTQKISTLKYTPSVIEPSFGVGRIMYGVLEHSYVVKTQKNGEKQGMLALSPFIAPVKVALLPFGSTPEFMDLVVKLEGEFVLKGMSSKRDNSGASIGRKYARADEIGVPFAISLDFDTIKDPEHSVTIRDRDETTQIRVSLATAVEVVAALVKGKMTWAQARKEHPNFSTE